MAYATRSITGLPPSLFSEGAIVINPNPIVDYANNVAARNQARQDAFTKYYADLGNNINTAGVHADDIPDIFSKKNDWQQFNMDNRKELMNPSLDNGAAYTQSNRLYNQALSIAQQSKSKVANLASIKPILDDPKKSALLTDGAVQAIHNASLKVTDPNYKAIDPTDINFNPKPFDLGDQERVLNVLKSIKPQQIPGVPIQDRNTGMQTQNFTPQYDKDQLGAMYQLGANLYSQHPGFKADVDKHASIDDPDYARLNAIYQQHFTPKNGFNQNITTPEDMAAAKIVAMNPNGTISPKVTPIPAQSAIGQQNQTKQKQLSADLARGTHQANRTFDINNPLPNASTNAAANGAKIVDDAIAQAKSDPAKYKQVVTHPDGTKETQWTMPIDQEVRNKLSIKDPATGKLIAPLDIRISDDGTKVTPIFYQGKENPTTGKRGINATFSVPMPRSDFDAVVGDVHKNKAPITNTTTNQKKSKVEKIQGW